MTSKEALEILNAYRNYHYNSDIKEKWAAANALNVILPEYVKLEEKDTPMKVIMNMNGFDAYCGNCGNYLFKKPQTYCDECGKKLDWSVDE